MLRLGTGRVDFAKQPGSLGGVSYSPPREAVQGSRAQHSALCMHPGSEDLGRKGALPWSCFGAAFPDSTLVNNDRTPPQ